MKTIGINLRFMGVVLMLMWVVVFTSVCYFVSSLFRGLIRAFEFG